MIETEVRISTKDTSPWQSRINALTQLGNLEKTGHHAHNLIEEIDVTQDKLIAKTVEKLDRTDEYFIRTRRWAQRRRARRMFI